MPTTMRLRLRAPRAERERATALILVPTMLLVVIALGAIAVDLTALHVARRSVQRVAETAADDAAAMLDTRRVQVDGTIRIDAGAAHRVAVAHARTASLPGRLQEPVDVQVASDGTTVTVTLRVQVRDVISGPVGSDGGETEIRASATARLRS